MVKLKNSNCDKTQRVTNSRTQMIKKNSNSNFDMWQNLNYVKNSNRDETQIVMKYKNSNCDETQLKLWQNQKNSNCDKIKRTQIVTKLKLQQNLNYDETQIVTKLKLWQQI